ncbi:hypothetical protein [Bacillus dakarensis]|uniref:hypothetical protein n=1 Tax=Robertmurraya dakarensis TaxID=1926278 RepID=UPI0009823570|nr:hypothetical protein [Bacillus dakarensis]
MKLPTVLAGPILRRIDSKQVFVWIALSKPYNVDANIFMIEETSQNTLQYQCLNVQSKTTEIVLGKKLYIYLIKIVPKNGCFPSETLLGYNLLFSNGSEQLDLGSLGLLSDSNRSGIVYPPLKYPAFVLKQNNEPSFMFGSCRKLHGEDEDALASGDLYLSESCLNLKNRPSALFLAGDQIYADDVADAIIPFIKIMENELIGSTEDLSEVDENLKKFPFHQAYKQVHGRQFIIEHFCKFTSTNGHNHLLTFGEFAIMYLLTFSPVLWDFAKENKLFPSFSKLLDNDQYYFIFDPDNRDEYEKELKKHESRFAEEKAELNQFHESVVKVQRLLANIPTYMIFDDHDITDDWNLSRSWKESVYRSPLGRHVIANGLGAYWIFQGWGNDPEHFGPSFIKTISNYLEDLNVHSPSYRKWLDVLLKYGNWSFVTATEPKALFLDTRTNREYEAIPKPAVVGKTIKEVTVGPQLVNKEGLDIASLQLTKSGWKEGEPLMIVSPAPLYGIGLIEFFLYQYVLPLRALRIPVHTAFDLEAWRYNGRGYHDFHLWIKKLEPSPCIVLSGDAHMASCVSTTIEYDDGQKKEIQQFTSSPMKNRSFPNLAGFLLNSVLRVNMITNEKKVFHRYCNQTFDMIYQQQEPPSYLWKEYIEYLKLENGSVVQTENNLGLITPLQKTANHTLLQYKNRQLYKRNFKN